MFLRQIYRIRTLALHLLPLPVLFLQGSAIRAETNIRIVSGNDTAWTGSSAPTSSQYDPPVGKAVPATVFEVAKKGMAEWRKVLQLDLTESRSIALAFYSPKSASGRISFAAGKGDYSRSFYIRRGEQIILLPLGTFVRKDGAAGWDKVSGIRLSFPNSQEHFSIKLLGISALTDDSTVDKDRMLLYQAANRVQSQGIAFPIYAILDDSGFGGKFQGLLEQLTGVRIPLNPKGITASPELANVIFLGRGPALKSRSVTEEELKPWGYQGFIIRAKESSITIAGRTKHGAGYGLYSFLEKQGCKFFTLHVRTFPKKRTNLLRACELADKPVYNVKGCVGDYSIKGWSYNFFSDARKILEKTGEKDWFDRTLWLDHTAAYLVPARKYYDEHPEYYALLGNGKRIAKDTPAARVMICLSNPDVLRISAERMLRWMELQNDREYFCVSQGDGPEWCSCRECAAVGNKADQTLFWANYVARKVANKFPDKVLVTNAYNGADFPPTRLKPEKNLVCLYAAWPNASSAPNSLRDFEAPENIVAYSHLKGWLKMAPNNMGLYDYNGRGRYTIYGMAWRVKWGAKHNMSAIWYCGGNLSFRELFNYVHCRLNWDPTEDIGRLKNEFIRAYYGKAAPAVRQLFDLIYDRLEFGDYDGRMIWGGYPPADYFDGPFVKKAFELFDTALKLVPPESMAHKDLLSVKSLFIANCSRLVPGRFGELTDDQYWVYARNLKEYIYSQWMPNYQTKLADAKEKGGKMPSFKSLHSRVWSSAYVDIGEPENEGELPALLQELLKNPRAVVEKHRQNNFVETLEDGWRLPGLQFTGGQHYGSYSWYCPKRVNCVAVRGTMTTMSRVTAKLSLMDDPPTGEGIIEIEAQDNDKHWCAPVPIQVFVNRRKIFEGTNGFPKQDWKRISWTLPAGTLKKGDNVIEIRNLAASDSLISHWVLVSEVAIRFRK